MGSVWRENKRSGQNQRTLCSNTLSSLNSTYLTEVSGPLGINLTRFAILLVRLFNSHGLIFLLGETLCLAQRCQQRPRFGAAVSTMALAMVSDAVAAGDGTLRTCSTFADGTNWKSSTNVPSGFSAWAR